MTTVTAPQKTAADYPDTQLFIDGQWCDAEGGKTMAVFNMFKLLAQQLSGKYRLS